MTNEEIRAGLEDLFSTGAEESEETEEVETEEVEETEEETEEVEEESEEETEEESEEESEEEPEDKDDAKNKQKARQNFEFARLRTENKKQANLLRNLGKALGLDPKMSVDDIAAKVGEVLLQKEAEEKKIPVEYLQRIQELESIAAENTRIKIENETQKAFTSLAEKYNLDSDALTEFATYLAQNGKNPLEGVEVDLETEYLKLHHEDIVKAAVDAALEEENKRKDKVNQHASSRVPGSSTEPGSDKKIETVAELDAYFSKLDV